MVRILYISNIDWKWIIQRPQIIALGLEKKYYVKVVWGNTIVHRWKLQHNKYPKHYAKGIVLPLQDKLKLSKLIYMKSIKRAIGDIHKYDLVWICDPRHIELIPKDYCGRIIYDCMDNYIEMAESRSDKENIATSEKDIINRAEVVFASSRYLINRINKKYGRNDVVLIRNGVGNVVEYNVPQNYRVKNSYNIAYVGTVASWVDLDLLYKTSTNEINYHIVGPLADRKIHPVIDYAGVVEHSKLYDTIKKWDCLIMPFKLNKIIKAVDPVKLYEYISFGKCIITIFYKEIERFSDFVYFYYDEESFISLINNLKQKGFPPKYTREQQIKFLADNSWERRIERIESSIDSLFE